MNGVKRVLHLVPSGVLHQNCLCLLGPGVVCDPKVLIDEIEGLKEAGFLKNPGQLLVSEKAHVIFPYHVLIDQLREEEKGEKAIGTTGRGIGPCYEDKIGRIGIRMGELLQPGSLKPHLKDVLESKNIPQLSFEKIYEEYVDYGKYLRNYIKDVSVLIKGLIEQKKSILLEGAQGSALDLDHGSYPYVTSSNTNVGAVFSGAGVPPGSIQKVLGVFKAYTTRVGHGPFPTELHDATGNRLQEQGAEFGSTTGRKRRCGWLDLVQLKEACWLNGVTELAVTKLDVLKGISPVRMAVDYKNGEPVYETMEGFSEEIGNIKTWKGLPKACQKFLKRIEEFVGVPIAMISVGPERSACLWVS